MDYIQKLNDSCSVIRNSNFAALIDKLIHSSGPESRLQNVDDSLASVNIADQLALSLGCVSSIPKKNHSWLHHARHSLYDALSEEKKQSRKLQLCADAQDILP